MGAGHGHGGSGTVGTGHAGTRHRWRLALAFALVGAFFVVELLAGLWSGSLALLSDAGHMAADVEPRTGPMLVVGGLGLVVNLIALVLSW